MAYAINQWVFNNMKKMKGLDIVRSVDILRELKGDFEEHTKLFTAIARSVGILTQINMGLVYEDGKFKYHSWPSVFADGVWYDLDPTYGQEVADATHIAIVRGDFERLVELLRIAGRISIKVLEYR
ncbi:MAG TPA: transglutaminase domain-containing protein [bacterium]|nr:transglutaminase domain-containing protein [bacterium]